jgi:hypothetical protein
MVLVFSSEPTKYTWTNDNITEKLFEWIELKPRKRVGEVIFPKVLLGLKHKGLETVLS